MIDHIDMRGRKRRENRLKLMTMEIHEVKSECDLEKFRAWYKATKKKKHITDEEVSKITGVDRRRLWRIKSGIQKLHASEAAGIYSLLKDEDDESVSDFLGYLGFY